MRCLNLALVALLACSACDMVDVYQEQIDRATRTMESAPTEHARAVAYADRGRGYSDKARLSIGRKLIDRDEYLRLFALALQDHDRAVALASGDAQVHFQRGLTYYDRAAWVEGVDSDRTPWFDAARVDFSTAVQKNPSHATAYDYLGMVDEQTGRIADAISDYTHVMALDDRLGKSRLADLYCNQGQAHLREKRFDLAADDLEKAVELVGRADGCSCEPYNSLAYVYIDATGQYDKGWELVHKARGSGHVIAREYVERLEKASGRRG
jgi:tetratricopeptide (TPR) repeat protein